MSRRYPELCKYLEEQFLNDPNVEVILDRRYGQRRSGRTGKAYDGHDRRLKDRRERPEVDAELLVRSHAIVTVEPRPGPPPAPALC